VKKYKVPARTCLKGHQTYPPTFPDPLWITKHEQESAFITYSSLIINTLGEYNHSSKKRCYTCHHSPQQPAIMALVEK